MELVNALDTYIPEPERELDKPFLMPIEDIFSIEGRGTVVTGRIERGMVKVGEEVEIVGFKPTREDDRHRHRNVQQISFRKDRQATTPASSCAARRRKTCTAAKSSPSRVRVKPHTEFEAEVYILTKEEGGRHTPFFSGYKPQFYVRTTDVTGEVTLHGGHRDGHAGRHRHLQSQARRAGRARREQRFAIREGGKTVGAGVVTKIIK